MTEDEIDLLLLGPAGIAAAAEIVANGPEFTDELRADIAEALGVPCPPRRRG